MMMMEIMATAVVMMIRMVVMVIMMVVMMIKMVVMVMIRMGMMVIKVKTSSGGAGQSEGRLRLTQGMLS